MPEMTKQERVRAALHGKPVDRVPMSLWGHDYLREWSAEGLAEATLERYRTYDWDFIKVNPRASCFVEDWGCRFRPSGDSHKAPELLDYVIKSAEDWRRLPRLDPSRGVLAEQIRALALIDEALAGEAPFVQTVFSPLSVTTNLVGGDAERVKRYMREAPETLHEALSTIADSYATYARACLERGADGIFFATTVWATRDMLTEEEYLEFGRGYDLMVLAAVEGASFNILHICRANNMFPLFLDYPVHAISWAATLPGNPTLGEALVMTDKAVVGGISEKTVLRDGPPEAVASEVRTALAQTRGLRFLLAPGCSIPADVPQSHLREARKARDAWS